MQKHEYKVALDLKQQLAELQRSSMRRQHMAKLRRAAQDRQAAEQKAAVDRNIRRSEKYTQSPRLSTR